MVRVWIWRAMAAVVWWGVKLALAAGLALGLSVVGPAFKLAVWAWGLDWLVVLVLALVGSGLMGAGVLRLDGV